ncbi:MAG: YqaA family protein [Thermoproteota archaeon]
MLEPILLAQQLLDWMEQLTNQYGYLGVFAISFIGTISIIFPIPYTIVIYLLGTVLDPFLIAISGGLGSALGELIGYLLGYFGRILISEERKKKMNYMLKIFEYYGTITIFLFSLAPLPDDLLIIPLGIMRYNPVRFMIPCILGKTLMCLILALGGRFSIIIIKNLFGWEGAWVASLITFLLLVIILVLMLKLDWEKIFMRYLEKKAENRKIEAQTCLEKN